jgi:hypothetical protein
MVGMLIIDSSPNSGIAITREITIKARKQAITTNIENISCDKGFISLNAVKAITFDFGQR